LQPCRRLDHTYLLPQLSTLGKTTTKKAWKTPRGHQSHDGHQDRSRHGPALSVVLRRQEEPRPRHLTIPRHRPLGRVRGRLETLLPEPGHEEHWLRKKHHLPNPLQQDRRLHQRPRPRQIHLRPRRHIHKPRRHHRKLAPVPQAPRPRPLQERPRGPGPPARDPVQGPFRGGGGPLGPKVPARSRDVRGGGARREGRGGGAGRRSHRGGGRQGCVGGEEGGHHGGADVYGPGEVEGGREPGAGCVFEGV
ncbi:hypothetical protein CT0861_06757, partial [Colletotrichum tofieldiae]